MPCSILEILLSSAKREILQGYSNTCSPSTDVIVAFVIKNPILLSFSTMRHYGGVSLPITKGFLNN